MVEVLVKTGVVQVIVVEEAKVVANTMHHTAILRGYARLANMVSPVLKTLHNVSVVNVGELDELADQLSNDGLAQLDEGVYHMNLGDLEIEKVLGTGRVTKKLAITAYEFSGVAREKIEAAGGSCRSLKSNASLALLILFVLYSTQKAYIY